MTWRAIHPGMTKEVRIPADEPDAPTFTLGFWPPLEAEKAKIYVAGVRKALEDPAATADPELAARKARHDLQAFLSMARFGVRNWSGLGDIPCKTETVRVDGREHQALSEECCDVLYHGGLLMAVALECWKYNSLSEEEKKTSDSQSSSSTSKSPTPATPVTAGSSPGSSTAGSYNSTAWSSTAVPTSSSTLRPGT